MREEEKTSHYVLIVHGTGNPPGTPAEWHQLPSDGSPNFCTKLNDILEAQYGAGRPVWRRLDDMPAHFDWGGENDHESRKRGGGSLKERIDSIVLKDSSARIHLVGHSHGCNVILKAVENYLHDLSQEAWWITYEAGRALRTQSPPKALESAIRKVFKENAQAILSQCQSALDVLKTELDKMLKIAQEEDALKPGPKKLLKWIMGNYIHFDCRPKLRWMMGHLGRNNIHERISYQGFRDAWIANTGVNRLGKIVFLGPPFMIKRWHAPKFRARMVHFLDDVLTLFFLCVLASLGGIVLSFISILFSWNGLVLMVWGIWRGLSLLDSAATLVPQPWSAADMPFQGLNPFQWSLASQVFAGSVAILSVSSALKEFQFGRTFRNVNLYFDEARAAGSDDLLEMAKYQTISPREALPLDIMVVSGGLLDEVALGFSIEPFVYGYLGPQVRSFLRCSQVGTEPFSPEGKTYQLEARRLLTAPLFKMLHKCRKHLQGIFFGKWFPGIERWLIRKVLNVVSAPAFGVVPQEFTNASIVATDQLNVSDYFRTRYWSVEKLFLAPPAPQLLSASVHLGTSSRNELERYAFLWDQTRFEQCLKLSSVWQKIELLWEDIEYWANSVPGTDLHGVRDRLARAALVLEETKRDIQLKHCAYYQHPIVIEGIARFIATGQFTTSKL